MQFLYSPLTWGFLLIGVPILVHLINLLRHRRLPWAAMDFLLESYRRNRRWVMLKQWLLLLARMLAMGVLVMMLAKWVSSAQWLSWLGGRTTHHFVLLDDSYSMNSLQQPNETAYQRGLRALQGLVQDIANQPGDHQITLVRWSRAALAMRVDDLALGDTVQAAAGSEAANQEDAATARDEQDSPPIGAGQIDLAADLLAQTVPSDPSRLLERIAATEPAALQLAPETVLELIEPTIANQTGELPVVYLLTDLRRNQFADAEALRGRFQRLSDLDVPIHLIDCAEAEGQNLSLVSLVPEQEVWAASVPLLVRLSVRNQSAQPARNVVVKVRTISYPVGEVTPAVERDYSGSDTELPPLVIESIEPGQTVSRQVQVIFPTAGQHVVEAALPDDVLATDNQRWCVIDIRQSQRILLVDGDIRQTNAFFFESVIEPGERLRTGLSFDRQDTAYLRDVAEEELATYDAVALLDVPRLDVQAISKLESYVASGGGVLFLCGPNTNLSFANEQLYRQGQGLLPVELFSVQQHEEQPGGGQPQVAVTEHPILVPLMGMSSSPFFALQIRQSIAASEASLQVPGLEIVATGPNRRPLIVDRGLGAGRVVVWLTGLDAQWSSWAQDPTFVVVALRSLGYLGSFRREATESPVGSDLRMLVARPSILPEGDILLPARGGQRVRLLRQVETNDTESLAKLSLPVGLRSNVDRALLDGLLRPGIFECWMMTSDGTYLLRNFAHNVPPEEGNLERISHQEIQQQFERFDLQIRNSNSLVGGLSSRQSAQSNILMMLLIGLLLAEQMLAYSASYHASGSLAGRRPAIPSGGTSR